MATDPEEPGLPATAEAVLTFLESVGRRSEAELYVNLFRELPKESFAIIAPGAPVIRQGQGGFSEQLRFLADLGLAAPLVLGLFDPAQAAAVGERLIRRMDSAGIPHSEHQPADPDLASALRDALGAGRWPIVRFAPSDVSDRLAWLGRVAADLDTRKVVLLRRRGHLRLQSERSLALAERHHLLVDAGGLSLVNLSTDTELITGQKLLRKEDAELFERVQALLGESRAERLLVSITSPLDLLRELFTVKGAGTLIKRGSAICRASTYGEVDPARLGALIRASFGHELKPEFVEIEPRAIFVEQDYRAAAILHDTPVAPYLTKLAVDPLARGEGLGRDLWQFVAREFPTMFWRTRAENPIGAWYAGVCDGLVRLPRWHVFWRGIEPARVPAVVEYALSLDDDFVR
jgi:ribosomal protein S18 acetylase RimI-like enzyme